MCSSLLWEKRDFDVLIKALSIEIKFKANILSLHTLKPTLTDPIPLRSVTKQEVLTRLDEQQILKNVFACLHIIIFTPVTTMRAL